MSTGWTAPGTTASTESPAPGSSEDAPGGAPAGDHGAPAPQGPRRELVQDLPLFPLRPLGLGEVLGASLRIYRLRARTVLGMAAIVYGIAFVIMTISTGAGMIPMFGELQASMENPEAATPTTAGASDLVLTIVSYAITWIVTMVAASLVTVALTRVAIGEASGRSVSSDEMWSTARRLAVPSVAIALLVGVLGMLALVVPTALGIVPMALIQEPNVLTIGAIIVGLLVGILLALWIWARTILAVPALVVEGTGVLGSIGRSFRMTAGRKLWRVLGVSVLLYLIYSFGLNIVAGVFGTVAFIVYLVVLLASNMQGLLLGMILLTIITMLGTYVATVLLAPFLSAGFATVYADNRMRHEAWDVELTRISRESWAVDGPR